MIYVAEKCSAFNWIFMKFFLFFRSFVHNAQKFIVSRTRLCCCCCFEKQIKLFIFLLFLDVCELHILLAQGPFGKGVLIFWSRAGGGGGDRGGDGQEGKGCGQGRRQVARKSKEWENEGKRAEGERRGAGGEAGSRGRGRREVSERFFKTEEKAGEGSVSGDFSSTSAIPNPFNSFKPSKPH